MNIWLWYDIDCSPNYVFRTYLTRKVHPDACLGTNISIFCTIFLPHLIFLVAHHEHGLSLVYVILFLFLAFEYNINYELLLYFGA